MTSDVTTLQTSNYLTKKGAKDFEKLLPREGWITVQNPHLFIDELIEIGRFSKIIKTQQ